MRRYRARPTASRYPRAAWVSLFAMLMIFIGPLVSQSMPMNQHAGMAMLESKPVSMLNATPASEHAHHEDAHAKTAKVGIDAGMDDHALWAKCGYCTLLFSCPALPQVTSLVAAAPPRPADFFLAIAQQGHARHAVFPNARSRAPPRLVTA